MKRKEYAGAICGGEFSLDLEYALEPLTGKDLDRVVKAWRKKGLSDTMGGGTVGSPRVAG